MVTISATAIGAGCAACGVRDVGPHLWCNHRWAAGVSGAFAVTERVKNYHESYALFGKPNLNGWGNWHLNLDAATGGMMGTGGTIGMSWRDAGVQPRPRLTAAQPSSDLRGFALRLVGAGLLAAAGAMHLDLYLTGFWSIPVIGWLFLLQVIAAYSLAAAVLVAASRLVAAAAAGFTLATLGGYLLSVRVGLFGFTEIRTPAGIVTAVIEVAAFTALAAFAATPATARGRRARPPARGGRLVARLQAGPPRAGLAVVGVALAVLALLGIAEAGAGGQAAVPASSGGVLRTARIGGVTVLTNARGLTLYWFVPDTPTRSTCYGTCAGYWPPVTGTPSAGPGVTGRLGTIKRSDGTTQITYNGHPLYRYVGDTARGQALGNGLTLNGGLWHEMTVAG